MASMPCQCCGEPVFDPNFIYRLPCGAQVCVSCYDNDFEGGEVCPSIEPGASVRCLDCIFCQVETGPEWYTYSDADPGL